MRKSDCSMDCVSLVVEESTCLVAMINEVLVLKNATVTIYGSETKKKRTASMQTKL